MQRYFPLRLLLEKTGTDERVRVYANKQIVIEGVIGKIPWTAIYPYEDMMVDRVINSDGAICISVCNVRYTERRVP